MKMSGAQIFVECLKREGVKVIFSYPGGVNLPVFDALYDVRDIDTILVRHEQGATHMAEGYARATGKPGVVLVTSGPGATNTVTGIADAYMDSTPIVVFTGQVPTHLIGNDAFQEADVVGITRPVIWLRRLRRHSTSRLQAARGRCWLIFRKTSFKRRRISTIRRKSTCAVILRFIKETNGR